MFDQDSIRAYIIEKLGSLRAETKMQKYNKNKESKNETSDPNEHPNSTQSKDNHNKPQNSPKDN